jgi:hypothetical protein
MHFMFKYRPMPARRVPGTPSPADASAAQTLPTQFIQSSMRFPLDDASTQERWVLAFPLHAFVRPVL